jgi:hypothetical protein
VGARPCLTVGLGVGVALGWTLSGWEELALGSMLLVAADAFGRGVGRSRPNAHGGPDGAVPARPSVEARRRALRDEAPVPVARCQDGDTVKLFGTIHLAETSLRAPLSGRACACYRARLEARTHVSEPWRCVRDRLELGDFHLEDGTGRALVRVRARPALVLLPLDGRSCASSGAARGVEALAEGSDAGRHEALRAAERLLGSGDLVAVRGRCHFEPDPGPDRAVRGYRLRPRRLVLDATDALVDARALLR